MRLVYHREPQEVAFQFFWVNEQNQRTSPVFYTEDEAKQWLIKSVTTTADEPPKPPAVTEILPDERKLVVKSKEFTDGYNAGKLYAELEYVELKQEILELIEDAKPSKLPDVLRRIKDLLK
jgi:hypothetical protein